MAQIPNRRTCAAQDVYRDKLALNPAFARARVALERQGMTLRAEARAVGIVKIPTVVHVIHRGGSENISDAQINSQIDVLNLDFRKKNTDIASIPAPFKPLAEDAMVEFALAKKDPEGRPTTGITRTQTNVPLFKADDKMKYKDEGGHDAWDTTRYLNIWVCPEIDGGVLGYAQFPGDLPATDGVVIIHNAFGTTGTASAPFDNGRTTTHEIGHWLDLYHIWGDKAGCGTDDKVADTPVQDKENYSTPTFPSISCNNGPHGDMFMNYMDYVDDKAMFMFSKGQVARMRATLSGPRKLIGVSAVAELAGVQNNQ